MLRFALWKVSCVRNEIALGGPGQSGQLKGHQLVMAWTGMEIVEMRKIVHGFILCYHNATHHHGYHQAASIFLALHWYHISTVLCQQYTTYLCHHHHALLPPLPILLQCSFTSLRPSLATPGATITSMSFSCEFAKHWGSTWSHLPFLVAPQ